MISINIFTKNTVAWLSVNREQWEKFIETRELKYFYLKYEEIYFMLYVGYFILWTNKIHFSWNLKCHSSKNHDEYLKYLFKIFF
jgi:hypothetical protein